MTFQCYRWLLVSLSLWATNCFAVGSAPAAPADYGDFAALQTRLERISQADFAALSSLGKTLGGRDVWLLTLGSEAKDAKRAAAKPAVLVVGSVQANDLVAGELAIQMAEHLLAAAASPDEATRRRAAALLNAYTLYIVPRPSPDASQRCFAELQADSALNERPTDDDRDGETNEDPTDDLDANGFITAMRVESSAGKWIPHPDDPRVMIEADPKKNERGRYLLYREGIDNDGDGHWNEDRLGGIDFNRNFTFRYPYFEAGAGPNQISEPETRAVADFAFDHTNIGYVYSFGPHDNIHHAWKPNGNSDSSKYKTAIRSADAGYQDKLVETVVQTLGLKDAPATAGDEGAFAPWAYFHYGRWSLATRPWWVPQVSREELAQAKAARTKEKPAEVEPEEKKKVEDARGADEVNAVRWLELNQIEGFVPWHVVEHPDFPGLKVEVGGFLPNVLLNPPPKFIAGLAEKHLLALAKMLEFSPRLKLTGVQCKSLGAGVYRLRASVRNVGYLPTMSEQGEASELVPGVQVAVTLPAGVKMLTGTPREHLPVLAGNGGVAEVSWVLLAEAGATGEITLKAWSPTVGSVEERVAIPQAK
jgi:hypothetical protein